MNGQLGRNKWLPLTKCLWGCRVRSLIFTQASRLPSAIFGIEGFVNRSTSPAAIARDGGLRPGPTASFESKYSLYLIHVMIPWR